MKRKIKPNTVILAQVDSNHIDLTILTRRKVNGLSNTYSYIISTMFNGNYKLSEIFCEGAHNLLDKGYYVYATEV